MARKLTLLLVLIAAVSLALGCFSGELGAAEDNYAIAFAVPDCALPPQPVCTDPPRQGFALYAAAPAAPSFRNPRSRFTSFPEFVPSRC